MAKILWLGILLGFSQLSFGQFRDQDQDTEIYLHTVNVGDMVYNNFGHTAIRVKNPRQGIDVLYNWGLFDFANPLQFSLKFYRGELDYKLGVYPYRNALRSYEFERRQVWEDRFNFTPEQKKIFLDKLRWNAKPENRTYSYQYFFDNCSTRPRDYIDLALGGLLSRTNQDYDKRSFRHMVRQGYQYNPFMDLLLEIGMNGNLDRPMTKWETMFHPIELRNILLETQVDGRPLLSESKVLFRFPSPEGEPHIFKILAFVLLVPLSMIIFMLQKVAWQRYYKKTVSIALERSGLRFLGILSFPIVLFFSFCGFMMIMNWVFSGHGDLHHNLNLVFFLPTDIAFIPISLYLAIKGRVYKCSSKWKSMAKRYMIFHIILATAAGYSWTSGAGGQDIGRVIYLGIPYLVILALIVNFGLVPESMADEYHTQSN